MATETIFQNWIFTKFALPFLLIFFVASIWGDLTTIYEIALVGPIGMVIFLALLAFFPRSL